MADETTTTEASTDTTTDPFAVSTVTNAIWADEAKTHIVCLVTFTAKPGEARPFGASATDSMEHGRQIFNDLINGKYGEIKPYSAGTPLSTAEQILAATK